MRHYGRNIDSIFNRLFAKCRVLSSFTLLLMLAASAPAIAQQPPAGSALEYHQLAPDARKLIVDEIRLELEADSQKRFADFMDSVQIWVEIGSGVGAFFVGLLALLGWRGLASLRDGLKSDMDRFVKSDAGFQSGIKSQIDEVVKEAASSVIDKSRREYNLGRLQLLAAKIEAGFTEEERNTMVETLLDVSNNIELRSSESFKSTASSIIDHLHSADRGQLSSSIDELDDKLRDVFIKTSAVCETLVTNFGERMLVAEGLDATLSARFEAYVVACRRYAMWERAAPYLLALASNAADQSSEKKIRDYFDEINCLPLEDKKWIVGFFKFHGKDAEEADLPYRVKRVRKIFSAFSSKYLAEIEKVCGPAEADADDGRQPKRTRRRRVDGVRSSDEAIAPPIR